MTIRVALPRIGSHNRGEGFAHHICKGGNMFDILGSAQRFCDGLSRRSFLKIGAFGAGLTLADMLRSRAQANPVTPSASSGKAAIMIYLPGGPSHMDMYDLKPA